MTAPKVCRCQVCAAHRRHFPRDPRQLVLIGVPARRTGKTLHKLRSEKAATDIAGASDTSPHRTDLPPAAIITGDVV